MSTRIWNVSALEHLRGIHYVYIIEDCNHSTFLFDTFLCTKSLAWYELWSRVGISLRDALKTSKSNILTNFKVSVAPDTIKSIFKLRQQTVEYPMVKLSTKKHTSNALNIGCVIEMDQHYVSNQELL